MSVIQTRKKNLVILGEKGVLLVPNTSYFSLKYNQYLGKPITYVISKTPQMRVREKIAKEFTCKYNKMEITITNNSEINELCEIILHHQKNQDTTKFVNFFCRHFAEQNQEEILDIVLKPYSHRINQNSSLYAVDAMYVIDGVFAIDRWGNTFVINYKVNIRGKERSEFTEWDAIEIPVNEKIEEYKIIQSKGKDLIMGEELQKWIARAFFLLNPQKKDSAFMVQMDQMVIITLSS